MLHQQILNHWVQAWGLALVSLICTCILGKVLSLPQGPIFSRLRVLQDFLHSSVVKNLPAKAGDTGLVPGPGMFHRPQSNWARGPRGIFHRPQSNWAQVLQLLRPVCLESVLCKKKPLQWEAHILKLQRSPCLQQLEKAPTQHWRPSTAKNR